MFLTLAKGSTCTCKFNCRAAICYLTVYVSAGRPVAKAIHVHVCLFLHRPIAPFGWACFVPLVRYAALHIVYCMLCCCLSNYATLPLCGRVSRCVVSVRLSLSPPGNSRTEVRKLLFKAQFQHGKRNT